MRFDPFFDNSQLPTHFVLRNENGLIVARKMYVFDNIFLFKIITEGPDLTQILGLEKNRVMRNSC